jgi:hypothetical protein
VRWARRRLAVAALALAAASVAVMPAPHVTDASWADAEHASGALAAGTVAPVTQMSCTAGVLQPVRFTWTPPSSPSGSLPRTGYRWTVSGGLTGAGTLPAGATTLQLATALLGLGSGTFSLYATGPGGWESKVMTGSLSFARVVLDVVSTCSVP